jgi:hypothetical protein
MAACGGEAPLSPAASDASVASPRFADFTGIADAAATPADSAPATTTAPAPDGATRAACAATCRSVEKPVGAAPYSMTFRFANGGATPLYVRAGCLIEFRISSCGRCYADDLSPSFSCGLCRCGQACGPPPACGACAPERGELVAPGRTLDVPWLALVARPTDAGAACHEPLPAEHYGIAVTVYRAAADAIARRGGREVRSSFALGGAATTLTVELAEP